MRILVTVHGVNGHVAFHSVKKAQVGRTFNSISSGLEWTFAEEVVHIYQVHGEQ